MILNYSKQMQMSKQQLWVSPLAADPPQLNSFNRQNPLICNTPIYFAIFLLTNSKTLPGHCMYQEMLVFTLLNRVVNV